MGGTACVCVHSTWHSAESQLCAPELQTKHVFNLPSIEKKVRSKKIAGAQKLVATITQHSQCLAANASVGVPPINLAEIKQKVA